MKFAWRLFIIDVARTWLLGLWPRWTATGTTLKSDDDAAHGTFLWPRCLRVFTKLVGNWRSWDFKCTQSFNRGSCPYGWPRVVTLCGRPVNYDVPGNIHYGWVGRAASIRRWLLLLTKFKREELMTPGIRMLSKLGVDLWDRPSLRSRFCSTIIIKIRSLNLHATSWCRRCYTRYY